MIPLPAVLGCALLTTLLLGSMGAVFGGVARVVARAWGRAPEATPRAAFGYGAWRGGLLLAFLGSITGAVVGFTSRNWTDALDSVGAVCTAVAWTFGVTGLVGLAAYGLEWLGVSNRRPSERSEKESEERPTRSEWGRSETGGEEGTAITNAPAASKGEIVATCPHCGCIDSELRRRGFCLRCHQEA